VELGPCFNAGVYAISDTGLTISQSYIHDTGLHQSADPPGNNIEIFTSTGVEVAYNFLQHGTSNMMAVQSTQVNVHHNHFQDAKGPFWRGQSVQFNSVTGTGNRINCNLMENGDAVVAVAQLCPPGHGFVSGCSDPEDKISIWQSQGDPSDPIQIYYNKVLGEGRSASAASINMIDGYGQYVDAVGNIVIDGGPGGIMVSTGSHTHILNNTLSGSQRSWISYPDGPAAQVWNQYPGVACDDHTVSGNLGLWLDNTATPVPFRFGGGCTNVNESNDNWNAPVAPPIASAPIPQCSP